MKRDIIWFKENLAEKFKEFDIEYFFFENGDFGDLNRVEINGKNKGGTIDFWSKDWLEIHLVDYKKGIEIIHLLLSPSQVEEKNKGLDIFLKNLD